MKLILASGSPRRSRLLAREGVAFTVAVPKVEEFSGGVMPAEELALANASLKAQEIASDYPDHIVLGSDTVVAIGSKVLGKPRDLAEGAEMLRQLSGNWHEVITAVSLVRGDVETLFAETTRVRFKSLSEDEIARYHQKVQVLDKAGGYAIQDGGDSIITEVDGCRDNVMGLPVSRVLEHLKTFKTA